MEVFTKSATSQASTPSTSQARIAFSISLNAGLADVENHAADRVAVQEHGEIPLESLLASSWQ